MVDTDMPSPHQKHEIVFERSTAGLISQLVLIALLVLATPFAVLLGLLALLGTEGGSVGPRVLFVITGVCFVVAIPLIVVDRYRLFRDRHLPLIVLNDKGLHLPGYRSRSFEWSTIKTVSLAYMDAGMNLIIHLHEPVREASASPIQGGSIGVSLSVLKGSAEDLFKTIQSYPQYRGT